MKKLSEERLREILDNFKNKSIAVIGDVMLDRYFWGSVSRVSPEAPVPVIDLERETFHLGGAANVAANLNSLGVDSILCGIIGDDANGSRFTDITKDMGIDPSGLYVDTARPTTVKTRIIGNNQHIARLDKETRNIIDEDGTDYIINALKAKENLVSIVFGDYNKGAISSKLISNVMQYAAENNIEVLVDPKKEYFYEYQGATLFKPNKKEACEAVGFSISTEEKLHEAGRILMEKVRCKNLLITLGADGMMLFEENGKTSSVPTIARNVADVSGAGDTAIATIAAAMSGGASVREASFLANIASGVVCQEPGIVSITVEEMMKAMQRYSEK